MKKKVIISIGSVIIGLVILFFGLAKSHSGKDLAGRYDFVSVQRMNLSQKIDATGTVEALEKKDLYSDYEGTVEQVNTKAGDYVKKGDVLVTVTSSSLKEQWQDANSALKQAQLNLNLATGQLTTEVAVNHVTANNALQLETDYHQIALYKEQVKQAQQRLDALNAKNDGYYLADNERLFIRAPFSGRVAWINAKSGDKITPQTVLATVIQPDALGVEAQIDENDIMMISTGQKAIITGKDSGQSQNSGLVTEIGELGQASMEEPGQTSGEIINFPIRIKLTGTPQGLKPGMSVDVSVLADEHSNVLAVPAGSVTQNNGRDMVNVRRGKRIIPVAVTLEFKHGKYWGIKSGLKLGDIVAVPKPLFMAKSKAMPGAGSNQRPGMVLGR